MAHLVLWWRGGGHKKGDTYLTNLISRFILAKNRQNALFRHVKGRRHDEKHEEAVPIHITECGTQKDT